MKARLLHKALGEEKARLHRTKVDNKDLIGVVSIRMQRNDMLSAVFSLCQNFKLCNFTITWWP